MPAVVVDRKKGLYQQPFFAFCSIGLAKVNGLNSQTPEMPAPCHLGLEPLEL